MTFFYLCFLEISSSSLRYRACIEGRIPTTFNAMCKSSKKIRSGSKKRSVSFFSGHTNNDEKLCLFRSENVPSIFTRFEEEMAFEKNTATSDKCGWDRQQFKTTNQHEFQNFHFFRTILPFAFLFV